MSDRSPFDQDDPPAPPPGDAADDDVGVYDHYELAPDDAYEDDDAYDDDGWEEWDDGWDDHHLGGPAEPPARRSRRGRRILTAVLVLLLLLALLAAGALVWVQRQIDPPGPPGEVISLEVPEGSTSDDIGALLAGEGIISSKLAWEWYLRINGGGPFQAGRYELARNSAIGDVIDTLDEGPLPPEELTFTVPEGLTLRETVARLADPERGLGFDADVMQQLLDSGQVRSEFQPPDQPSNEGILFPETYRVPAEADELAVLQRMVAELDATLRELDVASAQERFNLTPYEILVVASLIEEETKVDSERGRVAQVIYNRLRQGIPLGIDATSRYEAELAGRDRGDIDFESDSPYNTRVSPGLPPTPIASPGRASIEAALNPEEGPWLYYVLQDEAGNHLFTDDYDEFLRAKERCAEAGLGCG